VFFIAHHSFPPAIPSRMIITYISKKYNTIKTIFSPVLASKIVTPIQFYIIRRSDLLQIYRKKEKSPKKGLFFVEQVTRVELAGISLGS
jgi:hypothetical protein